MVTHTHELPLHLSPRGRGLFAMTYVRDTGPRFSLDRYGADVSHSANRVRGYVSKAPSSAPSGHLLPSRWKRVSDTTGRRTNHCRSRHS
jgi:hypothetical protein